MGITNTPSPGTDGAVCECGLGWPTDDGHHPECPRPIYGTGRAKADCAPVAEEAYCGICGALQAANESACPNGHAKTCLPPSPSKRDATEVGRYEYDADNEHMTPELFGTVQMVTSSDHTAAIQASLAREAALEAELQREREASARNDIAGYDTIAEVAAERDTLRSRLAAVEAERDRLKAHTAEDMKLLNAANAQLALQAEKVGRMREALDQAHDALTDPVMHFHEQVRQALGIVGNARAALKDA